jgi:hypothetical protein
MARLQMMRHLQTKGGLLGMLLCLSSCGIGGGPTTRLPLVKAEPEVAANRYTTKWQAGAFEVVFQAGEKEFGSDEAPSSFHITRTAQDGSSQQIRTESYFSRSTIDDLNDIHPAKEMRVAMDAEQRHLMIDENIPNECGPWTAVTLVTADANGHLSASYLDFPSRKDAASKGEEIDWEYPELTGITGSTVTWRYPGSRLIERKKFSELHSRARPASGP